MIKIISFFLKTKFKLKLYFIVWRGQKMLKYIKELEEDPNYIVTKEDKIKFDKIKLTIKQAKKNLNS